MKDILTEIHNSKAYAKGAHDERIAHFQRIGAKLDDSLLNNGPLASMVELEKHIKDIGGISDCQLAFTIHLLRMASNDHAEQFHMQDEYTIIANCTTTDNFTVNDLTDCQGLVHW